MDKDVIVALDVDSIKDVDDFLATFCFKEVYVKVGMELFYLLGPDVVRYIKSKGHRVFLDLKLHDIPNTVSKAMRVINKLDVDMVNVHAMGGVKMMSEAREVLCKDIKLIAVTQLTSSDEGLLDEINIGGNINDSVLNLALNAKSANLDGIVCSNLEVDLIKSRLGSDFICVTPGIRLDESVDDQKRVVKPSQARNSDYIVVGRPIMKSADKVEAYDFIKKEFLDEY